MDDPTKLPEGNTEPVMLPPPAPATPPITGTEADSGLVAAEEIDEMVRAKTKPRKEAPPAPPPIVPPKVPPVDTKGGSAFWLWLTFGLVAVGITVGVWAVLRAKGGSPRAAPGQSRAREREAAPRDPAGGA